MKNFYYDAPWTSRLGALYAQVIVGATETSGNLIRSVSNADARGAYATSIRRKLDESRDPALLTATGSYLTQSARSVKVDFDHVALGARYLQRAVQIDPTTKLPALILSGLQESQDQARFRAVLRSKEIELARAAIAAKASRGESLTSDEWQIEERALATFSEVERFAQLPGLAASHYMGAEARDYTDHDAVRANAAWRVSKKYANDVLALAPKFENTPEYRVAVKSAKLRLVRTPFVKVTSRRRFDISTRRRRYRPRPRDAGRRLLKSDSSDTCSKLANGNRSRAISNRRRRSNPNC